LEHKRPTHSQKSGGEFSKSHFIREILSQGATKQQKGRNEIAKKGAREISDSKSNIIEKLEILKRIYKRYTSEHT